MIENTLNTVFAETAAGSENRMFDWVSGWWDWFPDWHLFTPNGYEIFTRIIFVAACLVALYLSFKLVRNIWQIWREKNSRYKRESYKLTAFYRWAWTTVAWGYVFFFIGYYFEGTDDALFAILLRPFLSSLEMFVTRFDIENLSDSCRNSSAYMGLFILVYASAITISISFVVKCLWHRFKSYFFMRLGGGNTENLSLNVFFGVNERSVILAKSICEEAENNENEKIVFVEQPGGDKEKSGLNIGSIFGLASYNTELLDKLGNVKYFIMNANIDPSKIDRSETDIFEILCLGRLKRFFGKARVVRFYFLGDDEEWNIKSMQNIKMDNSVTRAKKEGSGQKTGADKKEHEKYHFFCRSNGRFVDISENYTDSDNVEIHLIDDSVLSVQMLKQGSVEKISYPVNYVEINKNGYVESDFGAMILGFGKTGQEAMKFLYEFGAFPDENSHKSAFRCHIVDPDYDRIKGNVLNEIPALEDLKDEIIPHAISNESAEFYELLKREINNINYIVIAVGDDDKNITLANVIYRFAVRYRDNMDKFRIFVRSYNPESERRMDRLVKYYREQHCDALTIFGRMKEIYSRRTIVSSDWLEPAKNFNAAYHNLKTGERLDKDMLWKKMRDDFMEKKDIGTRMLCFQALKRIQFQTYENYMHMYTKVKLFGGEDKMKEKDFAELPSRFFEDEKQVKDMDFNALLTEFFDGKEDVLSRKLIYCSACEHMRWVASHQMMGYVLMPDRMAKKCAGSCDERTKTHKSIRDWKDIDTPNNDYAVVKTTIGLVQKKL